MAGYHYHKRYLIYINRTTNPSYIYHTLISESLSKLHKKIPPSFHNREYQDEKIKGIIFIPDNMKSIDIRYYNLIKNISLYFDCISIWRRHLEYPLINPINTFEIYGYHNDVSLAIHYLSCIINSFNHIKDKRQEEYRVKKNRTRNSSTRVFRKTKNARTKAISFMEPRIELITKTWAKLLKKNKRRYENISFNKRNTLINLLENSLNLDYRNYKNRHYTHAYSRKGKFQKNRIIC